MTASPVHLRYEGDGEFRAASKFMAARCDSGYVCGETYQMLPHEERSGPSHRQYFASIAELWAQLPDHYAGRWLSSDDLRKHALIHTGYANPPQHTVCATKTEARNVAKALAQITVEYAEVVVDGTTVTRLTARSQSYRAMKKAEFQASKQAVLEYLTAMVGVDLRQLAEHMRGSPAQQSRRITYEEALRTG